LFMVADDENRFAEIQGNQSHHVALAGFVNDDNVEARHARIEIFNHARQRHDPNGNSAAAFAHFSGGFRAQERNADAMSFADAAYRVEPPDKRLALARRSTAGL